MSDNLKNSRPLADESLGNLPTSVPQFHSERDGDVADQPEVGYLVAGRYEVRDLLGTGGMGRVFQARDQKLERDVVLKFIRPDLAQREDLVERLLDEALASARLNHRHIVTLFDHASDPQLGQFLVQEYVDGPDLLQVLESEGKPLPLQRAVKYTSYVGEALQVAHDHGIVHRDVKPSNILINAQDEAKLADFGIARSSDSRGNLTQTGSSIGTLDFMAPEQLADARKAGPQSDQYSLAATLYQLVTNESPKVMDLELVSGALRLVLRQALRRNPSQRFESMNVFLERLKQCCFEPESVSLVQESDVSSTTTDETQEQLDLSELVRKMHEEAEQAHQRAQAAMENHAYEEAVKILEAIQPKEFRIQSLLDEARQKEHQEKQRRNRLNELDEMISTGVRSGGLRGLTPTVEELLQLDPHREDMSKLLVTLQEWGPDKPVTSASNIGTDGGERLVLTTGGIEYAFRWCPPGTMAVSNESQAKKGWLAKLIRPVDPDAKPLEVELTRGFWMQETTVTQQMWRAVMDSEPWHGKKSVKVDDRCPATYVNWRDATDFCAKLTQLAQEQGMLTNEQKFVLPTEARWEYAAQARALSESNVADEDSRLSEFAWWGGADGNGNCHSEPYAHEVGQKKANPWGLLDVYGNVWEWCQDRYGSEPPNGRDPSGPSSGSSRLCRGGSWGSLASYCRPTSRYRLGPTYRSSSVGFRVLCEYVD